MYGSAFRGLNHALNPDPTSELESEEDKVQVQRHNIGNACREVSTKPADVETERRSSKKDQYSINMKTELEEPTRENKEEFTGDGKMRNPVSKGKRGNPKMRNPDRWSPGKGLHRNQKYIPLEVIMV